MARPDSIQLNSDLATQILNKTLEELQAPPNARKLDEAKETVGNEMTKTMQYLFPIVMQVQMDVIKEFGYASTKDGIIQFAQALRGLERDDAEIARLHGMIKAYYMPPVSVNACTESPAEDRQQT